MQQFGHVARFIRGRSNLGSRVLDLHRGVNPLWALDTRRQVRHGGDGCRSRGVVNCPHSTDQSVRSTKAGAARGTGDKLLDDGVDADIHNPRLSRSRDTPIRRGSPIASGARGFRARAGDVAEWLTQRPAKPFIRVRFPASPPVFGDDLALVRVDLTEVWTLVLCLPS